MFKRRGNYKLGFGDESHNSEPWSRDEDDISTALSKLPYHADVRILCHQNVLLTLRFFNGIIAVGCIQQEKNMVMSKTHSEKRKFGKAGESSANKKARREVSKKYGKFTEDCIPDGVFPIGDDVFVFASTYYDSVSVNIRRFKKCGKTYYSTPEGITLDPRWIEYIMRKKKVPESLEELPSGLFPPERHIQITSENFIDFTFKRIQYGPDKEPTFKEITISREQWAEMIKKYGAIENAAIDNMFQCMDFLTAYKTFCEGPIENTLPSSLDVSLGQQYLTQILKKSICSLLNEKGMKQPQTFASRQKNTGYNRYDYGQGKNLGIFLSLSHKMKFIELSDS
ncbi:hypothetical protein TNCV_2067311 [Trichonephila clavipes]|uniref:Uncharacterized protein n=1 Tax=Trichonephila clavipes TaxID=2585209 RepID=A0A8X6W2K9_TRICX|nr:hypothetical protein TNCV_2067311 [Trichonephila clavipes]